MGILSLGGIFTGAGREEIRMMNRQCIERNLSPGGAADMLALTIFLWELESGKCWDLEAVKLDREGVKRDGIWTKKADQIA